METKICSKCEEEKILLDFSKDKHARDGLRCYCRMCANTSRANWYQANREKVLKQIKDAQTKDSRKQNSERCIAYKKREWVKTLISRCHKATKERNSRGRNHEICTLTEDWVMSQIQSQQGLCYWSGLEMALTQHSKEPLQISIDRLDNSKGYSPENCVLCTVLLNRMRGDLDVATFKELLSKVHLSLSELLPS